MLAVNRLHWRPLRVHSADSILPTLRGGLRVGNSVFPERRWKGRLRAAFRQRQLMVVKSPLSPRIQGLKPAGGTSIALGGSTPACRRRLLGAQSGCSPFESERQVLSKAVAGADLIARRDATVTTLSKILLRYLC